MDIEYIKTGDVDLAATFLAMGFSIDGIYARQGKVNFKGEPIMDFYIKKTTEADKLYRDYMGGLLKVEPKILFASRKEIITRMKDETVAYGTMPKESHQE